MSSDSVDSLDLTAQTVGLLGGNMEARNEQQTERRYRFLYNICTGLGALIVLLVFVWSVTYRGGFAWTSNPALEFNWHPFLMVTSFIFLYSQSILVYRTGRNKPKKSLKLWHALIHILAFILSVIGLQAAFDSHNLANPPKPNLYTLHSWIGLSTAILFAYQLVTGFIAFLYPTLSKTIRTYLLPVHTSIGTGTFLLAIIAACTGLLEKGIILDWKNYAARIPEAYLINFLGLFIAFFGVLVLYLVNEVSYKRQSLPDDELNLTGHVE